MLFNSAAFTLFFPLVTAGYYALPHRWRWVWLLGSSMYFYMSFVPVYVLILLATIVVDFVAGIAIEGARGARRTTLLGLSLLANLGALAFFKYFNFLARMVDDLAVLGGGSAFAPTLRLLLPLGLSFHTFQSMSYTIEVYRGAQRAERHIGIFALYVFFYPQLVAGPIERPQNLLHQFREVHHFEEARIVRGLQLMGWGFIKKMVVADRLAPMVNSAYDSPRAAGGLALAVATVLFAFQIYCDFSGYSDIALGSAEVMGFRLMRNFSTPYVAQSVGEFWRRWHISLSTWFRDYLFIPLGGSRGSKATTARNLAAVFLLSGLWHGASWTYVIWGALHATYLVVPLLWRRGAARDADRPAGGIVRAANVAATFALVSFAWVFFRARSVSDACYIVWRMIHDVRLLTSPSALLAAARCLTSGNGVGLLALPIGVGAIVVLLLVEAAQRRLGSWRQVLVASRPSVRWSAYAIACFIFLLFAQTSHASSFIYFQF